MKRRTQNNMNDLNYYQFEKENQILKRKRAAIQPKDVAVQISAFANAEGGRLIIGVEDDGELTGFKIDKARDINNYIEAPFDFLTRIPKYEIEKIGFENAQGEADEMLIFHVEPSYDSIISLNDGSVYLRVNDKSRK